MKGIKMIKIKRFSSSFTLIEFISFLVVIIVLSFIIIISIYGSKNKTKDAAIINELVRLRSFAEVIISYEGSYKNLCLNDNEIGINNNLNGIGSNITNLLPKDKKIACKAEDKKYCIAISLHSGDSFCISSDGSAGSSNLSPLEICPVASSNCKR